MVFKKLRYYIKIWFEIFKLSLSKASIYKIEVFVRFLRGVMLVAIQIIFIKAIVGNSGGFAGWSEDEMYLLSGIYNFVNYLAWSLYAINLWRMEEKILKGDFDFLLLKPTSSIFSASFADFFIDDAISGVSGIILVGYYFINNWATLNIINVIYGFIATFCAFIVWFSLELIFASFDFIQIRNGLREIKRAITNVSRFPMEIWGDRVRPLFFSLIPMAFVGVVPAGLISGLYNWKYLLLSVLVSILMLFIARFMWYFALKRYSSNGG